MKVLPILALLAGCTGCHPQPIPTPIKDASPVVTVPGDMGLPGNEYGLTTCPLTTVAGFSDVCDAQFTSSGLACAHCTGASGCYDSVDAVYCAKGPAGCLGDSACVYVKDGTDGAPAQARKKLFKKATRKVKRRQ